MIVCMVCFVDCEWMGFESECELFCDGECVWCVFGDCGIDFVKGVG